MFEVNVDVSESKLIIDFLKKLHMNKWWIVKISKYWSKMFCYCDDINTLLTISYALIELTLILVLVNKIIKFQNLEIDSSLRKENTIPDTVWVLSEKLTCFYSLNNVLILKKTSNEVTKLSRS